jgi:hypothetical protein
MPLIETLIFVAIGLASPMRVIDTRKQLPQRKRNRRSMIMDTEEWREAVKKIDSGLKPHEGIELVVSAKAKADVGENADGTEFVLF